MIDREKVIQEMREKCPGKCSRCALRGVDLCVTKKVLNVIEHFYPETFRPVSAQPDLFKTVWKLKPEFEDFIKLTGSRFQLQHVYTEEIIDPLKKYYDKTTEIDPDKIKIGMIVLINDVHAGFVAKFEDRSIVIECTKGGETVAFQYKFFLSNIKTIEMLKSV